MKRSITIALFFALVFSLTAFAGSQLPSSVSGVYITPDRVARIQLSRLQTFWVQLDVRSLRFGDGSQSAELATLWSPSACPDGVTWPLDIRAPIANRTYFRVLDVLPGRLEVVVGADHTTVANGVGKPQTWYLLQPFGSRSPYTCGSTTTTNPWR